MSDIVVRLRFWGDSYHLHKESADEIEKLRAENKRLRAAFQKYFGQSEATNVRAALGEKE